MLQIGRDGHLAQSEDYNYLTLCENTGPRLKNKTIQDIVFAGIKPTQWTALNSYMYTDGLQRIIVLLKAFH